MALGMISSGSASSALLEEHLGTVLPVVLEVSKGPHFEGQHQCLFALSKLLKAAHESMQPEQSNQCVAVLLKHCAVSKQGKEKQLASLEALSDAMSIADLGSANAQVLFQAALHHAE